ncbi:DNA-binding transcriptional MerR regulator [Crossiella equi]|uniref:DNA-binding transcriptional MerR regulator n=1 Tax=Crossiella equi TaxID=130796 RepID=A0ABS5AL04_9PSEU|nr:MerR family transcriptional regulator [Crossiella equi]MBP2477248.1 DNA-binding transcriptional MerR regulator [Crossiella equi]
MRIGELARRTGTTPRALRHYEQSGLLTSTRGPNGYRDYPESAVTRVRNIAYFLAAGLTLDDVRAFDSCLDGDVRTAPPSPAGLAIARARLAVLNDRIAAQTAARDRLATSLALLASDPGPTPGSGPPSDVADTG